MCLLNSKVTGAVTFVILSYIVNGILFLFNSTIVPIDYSMNHKLSLDYYFAVVRVHLGFSLICEFRKTAGFSPIHTFSPLSVF